ncbi:HET-domain-containing protein [Xylaria sp. FL0064]|nr:HET-domain-containing protein [Xylaria sp. FL0064]
MALQTLFCIAASTLSERWKLTNMIHSQSSCTAGNDTLPSLEHDIRLKESTLLGYISSIRAALKQASRRVWHRTRGVWIKGRGSKIKHSRATLDEEPSNDANTYDALSYTWGSDEKTHTIRVGDAELPITANLHQALVHLRRRRTPRSIWADAICINQEDIPERNEQVKKMAQIYSSASEVIIWLGPEEEDVDLAIRQTQQADSAIARYGENYVPNYHLLYGTKGPNVPSIDAGSILSFNALLERPWFERTWIIQEAMLAKKATITCGSLSLPFRMLLRVFEHWHRKGFRQIIGVSVSRTLFAMIQVKAAVEQTTASLLRLLFYTTGSDSSDPRDRVFGLMNLVSGDSDLGVDVDYNFTCAAVYTQLARHQIIHNKRLEFLTMAGLALYSGDLDIPSWVADWSKCDHIYMNLGIQSKFSTAGDSVARSHCHGTNGLEISAFLFDVISDAGTEMLPAGCMTGEDAASGRGHDWLKDTSRETDLQDLFADLDRLTEGMNSYPTSEDVEHVKLRTVLFDFNGKKDSPDWVYEYQAVHNSCRTDPSLTFMPIIHSPSTDSSDDFNELTHFDERKETYLSIISDWTRCRVLCRTKKGYLGWVLDITMVGDSIFIIMGANVPFVVRPVGDGTYKLIGECYIHGIMYGEALEEKNSKENIILT